VGRVHLFTGNPGKAREVRDLLAAEGHEVTVHGYRFREPQTDLLEEVVRAKIAQLPPLRDPCLVEDSGLFVEALGGFPGVYSAYVFQTLGVRGLLRALPRHGSRRAIFRTVLGVRTDARSRFFEGRVEGRIAATPRGTHGFGFDPVFIPENARKTFAEMTRAEKNRFSHRSRALRRALPYL